MPQDNPIIKTYVVGIDVQCHVMTENGQPGQGQWGIQEYHDIKFEGKDSLADEEIKDVFLLLGRICARKLQAEKAKSK